MKKIILYFIIIILLNSCKGCISTYQERKEGLKQVCPQCTLVLSENYYFAVDTSHQPNIIYQVRFRTGGIWHKAWEVDKLVRVN